MPNVNEIANALNILNQAGVGTPAPATAGAVAQVGRKPDFNWDSLDDCIRAKDPSTGYDLLETNGTLVATIKVACTTAWKANGFGAIKWDWKSGTLISVDDPKVPTRVNADMRDALIEDIIPMLFQLKIDAKARSARKAQEYKTDARQGPASEDTMNLE